MFGKKSLTLKRAVALTLAALLLAFAPLSANAAEATPPAIAVLKGEYTAQGTLRATTIEIREIENSLGTGAFYMYSDETAQTLLGIWGVEIQFEQSGDIKYIRGTKWINYPSYDMWGMVDFSITSSLGDKLTGTVIGGSDTGVYATTDVGEFTIDKFVYVVTDTSIKVSLDGKSIEFVQKPFMEDSRTLVPIRPIVEAIGATVTWDGSTGTAQIQYDGKMIELVNEKSEVNIKTLDILKLAHYDVERDGDLFSNPNFYTLSTVTLDVPMKVIEGWTYVPARFVAEAFDKAVDWNAAEYRVLISTTKKEYTNRLLSRYYETAKERAEDKFTLELGKRALMFWEDFSSGVSAPFSDSFKYVFLGDATFSSTQAELNKIGIASRNEGKLTLVKLSEVYAKEAVKNAKDFVTLADEVKGGKEMDEGTMYNLHVYFSRAVIYDQAAYQLISPVDEEMKKDYENFWVILSNTLQTVTGYSSLLEVGFDALSAKTGVGADDLLSLGASVAQNALTVGADALYVQSVNELVAGMKIYVDGELGGIDRLYAQYK
ncbi:MAG: copper amine oxidase N-terminal domain-containing protein [Clostridiales bacterium]|jgi:hypothetical protein|nr:copper amine oxidase N-terminal domain-containing protein [Clostridiales bacterium]